jgi:hypothetical protein
MSKKVSFDSHLASEDLVQQPILFTQKVKEESIKTDVKDKRCQLVGSFPDNCLVLYCRTARALELSRGVLWVDA